MNFLQVFLACSFWSSENFLYWWVCGSIEAPSGGDGFMTQTALHAATELQRRFSKTWFVAMSRANQFLHFNVTKQHKKPEEVLNNWHVCTKIFAHCLSLHKTANVALSTLSNRTRQPSSRINCRLIALCFDIAHFPFSHSMWIRRSQTVYCN